MLKKHLTASVLLLIVLTGASCATKHDNAAGVEALSSTTPAIVKPITSDTSPTVEIEANTSPKGKATHGVFVYEGIIRTFDLYIPADMEDSAPLIVNLHGYLAFSTSWMNSLNLNAAADKYGFAVCYPQGLSSGSTQFPGTAWNADFTFTNSDDVGFLTALTVYLQEEYGFNPDATFGCGLSNGGFMCYTMAVRAPGVFKAIASVAGTVSAASWEAVASASPISILQIHGALDTTVPMDGSMTTDGGWGGAPPISEILAKWAEIDGLTQRQTVQSGTAAITTYSSPESKYKIEFCLVANYGHNWPSSSNSGFDASEYILEFFSSLIE